MTLASAEIFSGKTVTIFAAGTTGGGYDSYARLLARHIGKHLPGNPTVMVRDMPGGGGLNLANYLANVAPRDGTEFGIVQDSVPFVPLLSNAKARFDPKKLGWLGSLNQFVPIVLAWHTTSFHSFDDLKKTPMTVGATGAGSSSSGYPKALNGLFGTKLKVVDGYPGSAQVTLAIERGELEGYASWCWTCLKRQKPDWYKKNLVRVLLQLSLKGNAELTARGVPTVLDIAKTDAQKKLLPLIFGGTLMARPFVAPPNVAPERLAILRRAFKAAANDSNLLQDAKRAGNQVIYVSPDDMLQIIDRAYETDPALVKRARVFFGSK
jgi:tripartite-type tricarboxylate transporter receptor subunit TctC